jgi:hypothetical protein
LRDKEDAISKDCSGIKRPGAVGIFMVVTACGCLRRRIPPITRTILPVAYRLTEKGAVFTPPAWKVVNVQPELEIGLPEKGGAQIIMRMTNLSDRPRKTMHMVHGPF